MNKRLKKINTQKDQEALFAIIRSQVYKNHRVGYQDKYDCAMDIFMNMVSYKKYAKNDTRKEGPYKVVPRKARLVNRSFLYTMVDHKVINWVKIAYRRRERPSEIKDCMVGSCDKGEREFLALDEIDLMVDILGDDIVKEYYYLFNTTVTKLAKAEGVSPRTIKYRRSALLDNAREIILNKNPQMYLDIKKPGAS